VAPAQPDAELAVLWPWKKAQVARDRLGIAAETVPGGHLATLAHPAELTGKLTRHL
jgi:hypothetical protein